jgi:hypothetical protein
MLTVVAVSGNLQNSVQHNYVDMIEETYRYNHGDTKEADHTHQTDSIGIQESSLTMKQNQILVMSSQEFLIYACTVVLTDRK